MKNQNGVCFDVIVETKLDLVITLCWNEQLKRVSAHYNHIYSKHEFEFIDDEIRNAAKNLMFEYCSENGLVLWSY